MIDETNVGEFRPNRSAPRKPITLKLWGLDQKGNEVGPIEFKCKTHIQGTAVMEAYKRGLMPQHADEMVIFIRECLDGEEEQKRFYDTVHSDNFILEIDQLGAVFQWLNEQYADRPTATSAASWNGPTPTGTTSTDVSTSTAPQTPDSWKPGEPVPSFTPA